jgi:hypothetical protein
MNMPRRIFNRYLVTGLAGGACIGFVAGRYSATLERDAMEPVPATEALRTLAEGAEGVHLIGLSIDGLQQLSLAGSERLLLERLGLTGSQPVRPEELIAALDTAIRRDYAEGRLATAGEFLLSDTEQRFIAYAVVSRELHETPYTPPQPEVRDGVIAEGAKFGPKFTVVGQIFNEQPDGHGGLWVLAENTPPGTVITINGREIKTTRKQTAMTGAVYDEQLQELIAKPARHEIALFVPETGIRQIIGHMEVKPRPPAATLEDGSPSTVFCEIDKWSTKQRADGEKIRIKTLCGPRSSAIYVGDTALTTKVHLNAIEGQFSRAMFTPGEYPLRLVDTLSGEAVALGTLTVD